MGRALRLHHPGSAFHVVARTQGREPWFVDHIKQDIADILLAGAASAAARPVAFCVMENHFHLLLFQGPLSLGETMQPIMRRIALLVQKDLGHEGHVFERRYRSKLCHDSEHLPNAILYVHRNPVAARIVRGSCDYPWSSARAYERKSPPGLLAISDGLRAFDPSGNAPVDDLYELYAGRMKRTSREELDGYWAWFLASSRTRRKESPHYIPRSPHRERAQLKDLRDVALALHRTIAPSVDLQVIRSRYGGPQVVAARRQIIAALSQRGFAGVKIARYMRVSETVVSKIRSAIRWARVPEIPK